MVCFALYFLMCLDQYCGSGVKTHIVHIDMTNTSEAVALLPLMSTEHGIIVSVGESLQTKLAHQMRFIQL